MTSRVLHISAEKSWRGGEQQLAYLLENTDVEHFVACRKASAFEEYCKKSDVRYISLPFFSEFDFLSALQIKKFVLKNRIEVLHLHSPHAHSIGVMSYLLGAKIPMVLSRKVDFPIRNKWLTKFKYNYHGIKKIICVSQKIQNIVSAAVDRPERCITIYDGIDLRKFDGFISSDFLRSHYKLSKETLLIGNVAAIADHKDYFTFLDTAALLKNKINARFFIIGNGPLRNEIADYITRMNLQNDVIMTGFLDDIRPVLPSLDILLVTSKTEGLGSSILDSFICRVPVVATAAGGIPEIVQPEKTGLLAPVKDSEELALQVMRILEENSLKESLINNAAEFVKSFDKTVMSAKTVNVYKSLTASV